MYPSRVQLGVLREEGFRVKQGVEDAAKSSLSWTRL